MADLPITLAEPQIGQLVAGAITRLRRIGPDAARIRVGDRLWVREPFHLAKAWGGTAPTTAIAQHARPTFVTQLPPRASHDSHACHVLGLGRRRFARELPRVAHRQHLVVTAIASAPLQAVTEAEAQAEGFASRAAWAAAWDRNLMFSTSRAESTWRNNPDVFVIDFVHVAAPLPPTALAAALAECAA